MSGHIFISRVHQSTHNLSSEIRVASQIEHSFHFSYIQEHFCALSIKIYISTSDKTYNLRCQVASAVRIFKKIKNNLKTLSSHEHKLGTVA